MPDKRHPIHILFEGIAVKSMYTYHIQRLHDIANIPLKRDMEIKITRILYVEFLPFSPYAITSGLKYIIVVVLQ